MGLAPRSRLVVLAVAAALGACAPRPETTEFLRAKVSWEPGVVATCIVVTSTSTLPGGSADTRRSAPTARPTDRDALTVAIFRDGRDDTATLQALGYADPACTTATGEVSEPLEVSFTSSLEREPATLLVRVAPPNLDLDGDGVPTPDDCDDGNAAVAPGKPERCDDGLDNDCDGDADCADSTCVDQACAAGASCRALRCAEAVCDDRVDNDGDGPQDCADGDCAGQACGTGGTCTGVLCTGLTEALCDDGVDNDGDLAVDCADSDCGGRACDDGDGCTAGEVCRGGSCGDGVPKDCAGPLPACLVNAGCDAGVCLAANAPVTAACEDGDPCTTPDRCDGDGGCAGTPLVCGAPPGPCFGAGMCQAALDGGCAWPVVTTNTCSDGDGCTVGDGCQPDGGCGGTRLDCSTPPGECSAWAGTCSASACDFVARVGACDGGTCSAGVCVPGSAWPYTPSNFSPAALPVPDGGGLNFSCTSATFDTGPGTPTFTATGCAPAATTSLVGTIIQLPANGGEAVLVTTSRLFVDAGSTLRLVGPRPVIFAVSGDVMLAGQLLVGPSGGRPGAGADPASGCVGGTGGDGLPNASGSASSGAGAGGGGFGTAGARGAVGGGSSAAAGDGGLAVGNEALVPLRGGCSGGRGGYATSGGAFGAPGLAGGAVQISSSGVMGISGTVGASGNGGGGGPETVAGAGGGGSGGAVLLEALGLSLTASARVMALGGGGGEGAGDGTGNDGNPGAPGSLTTNTAAAGGSGGSSRGGEGGAGASNMVAAVAGSAGIVSGTPGGGGAGGAGLGRVRFNVTGPCSFLSGALVVPTQSTPDGGCR